MVPMKNIFGEKFPLKNVKNFFQNFSFLNFLKIFSSKFFIKTFFFHFFKIFSKIIFSESFFPKIFIFFRIFFQILFVFVSAL